VIGNDRYFKRDDVGIIYQMNVLPGKQRGLIGATLVKAMFERAAYGCKLFCCWCAQDIAANHFWEAMGFVPLAFRTGSRGRGRVHIFWQRRVRQGDTTTPWWFPSETGGGSIREDRIVLPIPPGTKWSDEMPRVLPALSSTLRLRPEGSLVEGSEEELAVEEPNRLSAARTRREKIVPPRTSSYGISGSKLHFVAPEHATRSRGPREKRKALKNDPRLVAAARELRDRWLEEVDSGQYLPQAAGKYDVGRRIEGRSPTTVNVKQIPILEAA
jgi:hypothetical protein